MNQQMVDLLKTQMVLGSGGGFKSFIFVTVFEQLLSRFPKWSEYLFSTCRRKQHNVENPPPPNKEIKAEIFEGHFWLLQNYLEVGYRPLDHLTKRKKFIRFRQQTNLNL